MAEKAPGKVKRTAKPGGQTLAVSDQDPVAALEAERIALRAELAAAKVRIDALEQANAQVLNRIAWMIDSLQSLKDSAKT